MSAFKFSCTSTKRCWGGEYPMHPWGRKSQHHSRKLAIYGFRGAQKHSPHCFSSITVASFHQIMNDAGSFPRGQKPNSWLQRLILDAALLQWMASQRSRKTQSKIILQTKRQSSQMSTEKLYGGLYYPWLQELTREFQANQTNQKNWAVVSWSFWLPNCPLDEGLLTSQQKDSFSILHQSAWTEWRKAMVLFSKGRVKKYPSS